MKASFSFRSLVGLFAAGALGSSVQSGVVWVETSYAEETRAQKSESAPTFKGRTVAGEKLDLAELLERGPVLLDFWATWCRPCVASIPSIQALHETYAGQGLSVVGVSVDGPRNYAKVRPFMRRLGITYPVVFDKGGTLQQELRIRAIPAAVLLSTTGEVLSFKEGYLPGEETELETLVEHLFSGRIDSTATDTTRSRTPR